MKPRYSVEGSTRREVEESVMDSFQDFFISLEDEKKISGYSEALTWNYEDSRDRGSDRQQAEEFQTADICGWCLGLAYWPKTPTP